MYGLDGNAYYARPGPRLLQGSGIIARLLHGDAVGDAIGEEIAPRNSWTVITEPEQQQQKQQQLESGAGDVAAVASPVTL